MNCVFARYDGVPAPCQGDDDPARIKVFKFTVSTLSQVEVLREALESRFGGYVQVWSTET